MKGGKCAAAMLVALVTGSTTPAFGQAPQTRELVTPTRFEMGMDGGLLLAGKVVGLDTNATGGEQLVGRLGHGGVFSARLGLHGDVLGIEAALTSVSSAIAVKNEFGVRFPNHGRPPALVAGRALLYPFRRALGSGRVRPFLAGGLVSALVSADLDNIDDQTFRLLPGWTLGAGIKWLTWPDEDGYVAVEVSELRFHGVSPFSHFNVRTITCGFGIRR
ncbi:MAG: hypothetical protein ACT4QD_11450 [Acidobacteriota bacterium]